MTPLSIALMPGGFILTSVLMFFQVSVHAIHPDLLVVFKYIVSYIFWLLIFKFCWKLTLRVTGFDRKGGGY